MIQLGSARRAARPHLANVLNSMGRLVLLPRGGWLKRGLKEHHCRSKEVQEDAVEIDDRAHFTVDDIREAIAASGACWRADMLLKEPIQGASTKCPTPMNFVSSAFTRSPALPASRALCRDVSWCPRRNSCSCRRHWATRTFKVGTDATFKDLFGDWKLMPLALLTKRLSRTTLERGIQGTSWCAHCMPMLCCITNSDAAASCEELMRAFDEVPLCKNWSPQHSSSFRALSAPRWQHSFVHAHPAAAWGLGQRGLEATCRIYNVPKLHPTSPTR